ncbi:MAG: hypothetical protein EA379_10655 [Phycisphaerales bacterium]|nr:MAG: hypothetical protein EA379_10655 [Phycisphaerales bacterium]
MSFNARALAHRLIAATLAASLGAFAVADLNPPPGPIAPTMRSLDQIEPRTPVQSLPGSSAAIHVISQPGSYYLTGDIVGDGTRHGIQINISNVTLDLNGFSLRATGGSGSFNGVHMPNFRVNVVIKNGNVFNWPGSGVNALIDSGRIERITASSNGEWGISNAIGAFSTNIVTCEAFNNGAGGILAGSNGVVIDCVARANTGNGIVIGSNGTISNSAATATTIAGTGTGRGFVLGAGSMATNCVASNNGSFGFEVGSGVVVRNSIARSNGSDGFFAAFNSALLVNCTAVSNSGPGFTLDQGTTLRDSTANSNNGPGIRAFLRCVVVNNTAAGNTGPDGHGILIDGTDNRVEGNSVVNNSANGLRVDGLRNLVIQNSASNNIGSNYNFTGTNTTGQIITGGGVITASNPWANFSN